MTNAITDSSDAINMMEAEQSEIKAAVDEFDKSSDDEATQINAHKALMELKRIRDKQRKV